MKYTWILLIILILAFFAVGIGVRRGLKKRKLKLKKVKLVANTKYIRELPEYKSALRKYKLTLLSLALLFLISLVSFSIVAARPISVSVAKPVYDNRDIMLCLDRSGSTNAYYKEMLEYFSNLLDEFKGQRVGMTIFDGTYLTISPLSDDYESLSELLIDFKENGSDYGSALYNLQTTGSSSEIGLGLVGCVDGFDRLGDEERSRAIILATDNLAPENPAVTLTQAANYAKRYNIAVYGLSMADYRSQAEIDNLDKNRYESDYLKEYREAVLNTGGAYYAFSSYSEKNTVVVSEIVDQILSQAAARYEGADTLVEKDNPFLPSLIGIISLILLIIIIWRLGL